MAQENEFTAPAGCILVRTEPPAETVSGVHLPLHAIASHRPDRGTIVSVDESEDFGLALGMVVIYDKTEATEISENLWSIPAHAVLADISKTGGELRITPHSL